ncbi:YoaK family protein [Duganella sp. S19_KUP01_CR8]|uniref:YoaK family protein n=1 Tax=Duganella sp. S19_KUP01_CR8 TaxID=3025502 RepID=UPI002FCD9A4D
MPMHYLRALTSPQRTNISNRRLGRSLAFVAGAVNAGGFFAVGQYTSHMTGIVSSLADSAAMGETRVVVAGLTALLAFLLGAATSAILINWGRRRGAQSQYALPLILEAALLLCFGLMGASLGASGQVAAIVALLCFVMGLQNAIITKVSRAEIRTTHVTGLVTDIGIELGKLLYWNASTASDRVAADRDKLLLLGSLLAMFLLGGLVGAFGFKYLGYISTVPLAVALLSLAIIPVIDDFLLARN